MRNLLRAAAACALTLAALSTVNAATTGRCVVLCQGALPVIRYTTQAECCGQEFPGVCPGGATGVGASWNSYRCAA